MRFFDRTEEIASLREIRRMSKDNAQFTVVTGRRRIGKTYLVWKAYEDEPILYFFVARRASWESPRWDGRSISPMCSSF